MRILIVDDEEPARDRLRALLSAFDNLEIVGEAEDGEQAMEGIKKLRPDLILLDIQMPGCSGIDLVGSLPSPRPKIIFCTAFEQYAVDAFELCAVDYLLKPVTRARLASAVERARQLSVKQAEADTDLIMRSPSLSPVRFLGKRGPRFLVIPQKDAVYLGSQNGLTTLHTAGDRYLMEPTLNDFEGRLDHEVFYRISRTAIVNLDFISEVAVLAGGHGAVLLKNGTRLGVSRRRFKQLLAKLEGKV